MVGGRGRLLRSGQAPPPQLSIRLGNANRETATLEEDGRPDIAHGAPWPNRLLPPHRGDCKSTTPHDEHVSPTWRPESFPCFTGRPCPENASWAVVGDPRPSTNDLLDLRQTVAR